MAMIPPLTLAEVAAHLPFTVAEIMATAAPFDPIDRCGIYFLIADDEILYVGKSVNIEGRVARHFIEGKGFTKYASISCPADEMTNLEAWYIAALRPRLNLICPEPTTTNAELREAVADLRI